MAPSTRPVTPAGDRMDEYKRRMIGFGLQRRHIDQRSHAILAATILRRAIKGERVRLLIVRNYATTMQSVQGCPWHTPPVACLAVRNVPHRPRVAQSDVRNLGVECSIFHSVFNAMVRVVASLLAMTPAKPLYIASCLSPRVDHSSSFSFLFLCPSVRSRSALRRMKPAASRWS